MRRKFGLSNMELNRTEEDNLTFFLLTLIVQVFNCQETTLLSVLYIFPLLCVKILCTQGCSETPSNQAFEEVKFKTIVIASDIFGKSFDVNFFILDYVIPQMPLSVIYQTRTSFFWSTRYTQRRTNPCSGFMP